MGKKHKIIAGVLAGIFGLLVLSLFGLGYYMVFEIGDERGYIPLVVSVLIALAQIILGIMLHIRSNKYDYNAKGDCDTYYYCYYYDRCYVCNFSLH